MERPAPRGSPEPGSRPSPRRGVTAAAGEGPQGRRYWRRLRRQKDAILNVRAAETRWLTPLERGLRAAARGLAHPVFLAAEVVFHLGWVALNTVGIFAALRWDPYPFPLLAGVASVQALFIGLLILMYEERSARVEEVREETELQVALHTEREATKLLRMVAEIQTALGIPTREQDEELAEMAQPLDPDRLRETTRDQLRRADEP